MSKIFETKGYEGQRMWVEAGGEDGGVCIKLDAYEQYWSLPKAKALKMARAILKHYGKE